MIGSYGRNAYGGRVGGRMNRRVNTISPKGATLRKVGSIGISKVARSNGTVKRPQRSGSSRVS